MSSTNRKFYNGPSKGWVLRGGYSTSGIAKAKYKEFVDGTSTVSVFPDCPQANGISKVDVRFKPKDRCKEYANSNSRNSYQTSDTIGISTATTNQSNNNNNNVTNETTESKYRMGEDKKEKQQQEKEYQKQPVKKKRKKIAPINISTTVSSSAPKGNLVNNNGVADNNNHNETKRPLLQPEINKISKDHNYGNYEKITYNGEERKVFVLSDSDEYMSDIDSINSEIDSPNNQDDEEKDNKTGARNGHSKNNNNNKNNNYDAIAVNTSHGNNRSISQSSRSSHGEHENDDYCHECGYGGSLYMCDGCSNSVHFNCLPEDVQEDIKDLMSELKKRNKNDNKTDDFNNMPFYCNECEGGFIDDDDEKLVENDRNNLWDAEGSVLKSLRREIVENKSTHDNSQNGGTLDAPKTSNHAQSGWKALIEKKDEEFERVTKEINDRMKHGQLDPELYPNGGFEQRSMREREKQVLDKYSKKEKELKTKKKIEREKEVIEKSLSPKKTGNIILTRHLSNDTLKGKTGSATTTTTTSNMNGGSIFDPIDFTGDDDKPEFVPGTDGVDDVSTVVPLNESVEQSMSDHNISNITTTSYSSPKGEVLPLQEKFMCFICGKKDFIFKKETCIWYDNVGKARKACEDCIDCVNTIEIKPEGEILVEL